MIGGCDRDARTLRLLMLILIMKRLLGMRRPKLNFPAAAAAMVTRFVNDAVLARQQRCQTPHTMWRPGELEARAPLKASKNEGRRGRGGSQQRLSLVGLLPSQAFGDAANEVLPTVVRRPRHVIARYGTSLKV